ncbi:Zn(II)2Cys6 transcription factor domain-containing protein [Aspergillus saccharolyticus JOP 1030-1]|uniref:Zn(2)-C6 fungal-type domain-containing protein n=1 Tax=Aspergillus saccharolyticus JOP 1030-1 TaxID=1450539 RepID=A0A318ZZL4_9EURO|nr:hypothetical protein BP01DRAFT_370376 [Aspergillus saccharolyticus JOP 1030-1]PYH49723.1 hypothetical protein BP01DRAFT_370376 [Aspergillus saccharolyticus JOP 1030-1]
MSTPQVRQRAYRTRTKSGCLTCKKRRIKCDETRPSCLRCTSTGRKCDGYGTNTLSLTNTSLPRPTLSLAAFMHARSEREVRSFQFFYEKTVFSLAGYCGSELWSRSVLQVSQYEKPVWHALVALGALHENFENDRQIPGFWFSREGHDAFALREYLEAIRALLSPSSSGSSLSLHGSGTHEGRLTVDVCLISVVLFVCYEIMSSHYVAAVNHIRSGVKILGEVTYDPSTGTYHHPFLRPSTVPSLEIENLRVLLLRLHRQAFTLVSDIRYLPRGCSWSGTNTNAFVRHELKRMIPPRLPCNGLDLDPSTYHRAFRPLRKRATYTSSITRYTVLLQMWSMALDCFEQARGLCLTVREQAGLKILQIHRLRHNLLLDQYKSGLSKSIVWDRYNAVFKEINSLAASVVEISRGNGAQSMSPAHSPDSPSSRPPLNPSFSLDLGIIDSLYDVATLCRDPVIRREAVDILRSASRQEGVFNSHVCAVVAEKVIALEEKVALEGSLDYCRDSATVVKLISENGVGRHGTISRCSEVPENARLTYAYPEFDTVGRQVFLTIGQDSRVHANIPLQAMTVMLNTEDV